MLWLHLARNGNWRILENDLHVPKLNTRLVAIAVALDLPLFVASASFFIGGTGVAIPIATLIVLERWAW
jgi:hypothetical protein